MPNYDYKCSSCQHQFEQFQKIDDRKKPCKLACPSCNQSSTIDLVIGAPAVCDPVKIGTKKTDKGWKEVLDKVRKANPRTRITNRFE
jgi:putative FmdB family regulatory protein